MLQTAGRLLRVRPPKVFRAKGVNRVVTVTADGWMTIRPSVLAWAFMSKRRRSGRPAAVSFPLNAIRGGRLRAACWWRRGVLVLDVPVGNDPWRRRSDRQVLKGVMPAAKPHRIRFTSRQQPWFVECALQIGVVPDE